MPAALTDDQKNVAPTTIGDALNALYDTYHNDSADSVSVDSDHKHTTLQAQMRPIPRTHNTTTPQTTKSHNERHKHNTTSAPDYWHYNIGSDGLRFTDGRSIEHYQHIRQFNFSTTRRPRTPYVPDPPPPDAEDAPWCDCCTAYLSENDNTQQGIRDPDNQTT